MVGLIQPCNCITSIIFAESGIRLKLKREAGVVLGTNTVHSPPFHPALPDAVAGSKLCYLSNPQTNRIAPIKPKAVKTRMSIALAKLLKNPARKRPNRNVPNDIIMSLDCCRWAGG